MKVLVSAYACEPNKGSEPGVGWNIANAIAQEHEVWVLTTATHQRGIEAELERSPASKLHWIYLDPLGWVYDWETGGKGIQWDVHLHHYLWQIAAYFKVKKLHQTIGFDIIHHATYGRYSAPSFLSFLPIPFVWGPVGGGESAPLSFWKDFNFKGKLYEFLRQCARFSGELDPFVHLTARNSAIGLACTPETAERMKAIGLQRLEWVSGQTGISAAELAQFEQLKSSEPCDPNQADRPVRFLSLGRLIHWKGFHLGVRAFIEADLPHAEYWIAGTGAEESRLKTIVETAGWGDRIKFLGALPRPEALQVMAKCDVLVHPSLHDFSPTVCLEAMAAGLPVICLDLGGPSRQITDETGIRVKAVTPIATVTGIAQAMQKLSQDSELRSQFGKAGQQRVREGYLWETRGKDYSALYRSLQSPGQPLSEYSPSSEVPRP
jgi:glycosyltransferase involved in cell wall biosynthesis